MQASIPNCSAFFKPYRIPIEDSPAPRIPQHLRPLLSQIITFINTNYSFERGVCRSESAFVTVKRDFRLLQIYLSDVKETFYVTFDDGKWILCDEDEFFQFYADGDTEELVWYPSQTN